MLGNALDADALNRVTPRFRESVSKLAAMPADDRPTALAEMLREAFPTKAGYQAAFDAIASAPQTETPPPHNGDSETTEERPSPYRMLRFAEITELPVEWLWRGRTPLGMVSLLAGKPKAGKSLLNVSIAAAVSRGLPLPGETARREPRSVVMISAEDDAARVTKARLRAAGADMTRVFSLESVVLENGRDALPSLDCDIDRIGQAVADVGDVGLVTIDPVSAYLGRVKENANAELRGVLSPLKTMVERLGPACMLTSHFRKGQDGAAQDAVIGSTAFVGACRANFVTVRDPDDPTKQRVFLMDLGGNLAPRAPTLAYRVEEREGVPVVAWEPEPIDIDVDDVRAREREAADGRRGATATREAEDWLRSVLSDGPVSQKEIEERAGADGLSMGTVRRAKKSLSVRARKQGFGGEAPWAWELP